MQVTIKIFIILIIILLYIMTMKSCFEYFITPYNSKISLANKSNYLIDRHPIDSINTDINAPINSYYYEFSNSQYLDILNDMFKPSNSEKYTLLRNIEWSKDIDSNITPIYNKAYLFISNTIAKFTPDIQIVHDVLKQYKSDEKNQEYILDIDMILYRNFKLNGKHVNFIIYVNHLNEKMIDIEIKGIVGEDKIGLHPIVPKETNDDYVSFEPIEKLV